MKKAVLIISLLVSCRAYSAVEIFENDYTQWSGLAQKPINVIDFDSIPTPPNVEISGDEFAGLALGPVFSLIDGNGLFVGNPSVHFSDQDFTPVSGKNVLYPGCFPSCEGVVRVTFDRKIKSFGAFFVDVEADFATTGFSLAGC